MNEFELIKPENIFTTVEKFLFYIEGIEKEYLITPKVVEVVRNHFHQLTLFIIKNDIAITKKEKTKYILNQYLKEKFAIPYEQQLIFEWDNVDYKEGSHFLVETSGDSCSFLVIELNTNEYLLAPTLNI